MKYFTFNYVKKFKCIASECKHSCCKGWLIKIDKPHLNLYHKLSNKDQRFNEQNFDGEYFKLNDNFCCPLLEENGLCYAIKNYGEKSISKTCRTHPRFINNFANRKETGLGLYCEETCRIILSSKRKMRLNLVKDNKKESPLTKHEKKVLAFRNKVIKIIQNRKISFTERLNALNLLADINLEKNSFSTWLNIFAKLEKLPVNDFSFEQVPLAKNFAPILNGYEIEYEQLISYFIFRHLPRAIDNLDLRVRLAFSLLSLKIINHIFANETNKNLNTLIEICRFYTSTIETSDTNLFALLNEIENLVSFC